MSKMIHTRSDERTQHQRLATTQQLEEKGRNEQEKAAIDPDPVAAVGFAVSILAKMTHETDEGWMKGGGRNETAGHDAHGDIAKRHIVL